MGIKHTYQSSTTNDGTKEISSTKWNQDHTIDSEVTFPAVASPATPAASNFNFFGRTVGGRIMPAFMGPAGQSSALQPHWGRNRVSYWQPLGNATTVPITTGFTAATALGTATARNVAATNILTRARRLGYVSASTAGSLAGIYWTVAQYTIGDGSGLGGFHSIMRFGTSDAASVSGARAFIGWSSSVAAPTNVDPAGLTNSFGLAQLSGDATQWYIVYGGSAAQTAIALGTGLGAPTDTTALYEIAFYAPNTSNNTVYYTVTNLGTGVVVSGTLTGTAGTALPSSSTFLAPRAWRTNNATALAVGIDVASIYTETDN